LNVVIAGDVPLLRSLVRMAVEESGFDVIAEANDSDELLAICSSYVVNIVIIDLTLMDEDHIRLIEKILDLNASTSIISVSDYGDGLAEKVLVSGARGYLQKPFSMYDLIDIIRKVAPVF
jgi:DNA-binding NarL/FixJ family response regulator